MTTLARTAFACMALAMSTQVVAEDKPKAKAGGESIVTVDPSRPLFPTAPDLWGIFFEDIDLSLDGGVYAELVRNRSFEDGNGSGNELTLEYWNPVGSAECFLSEKPGAHPNDRHCVTVRGKSGAGIANEGYFGMGIRKGESYNLSVAFKSDSVKAVEVALEAYSKPAIATARIEGVTDEWKTFNVTLVANDTDPQCRLVFRMGNGERGTGEVRTIQLDHVSLFPADAVAGVFRRDLVERLAALRPSFLRFPGGCWVEGETMKDAYRWKTTIGDKWNRRTQWNIWKYWSTNGVGFHEYLLLCEALGAKPLFCINCGMSHKETVPMDKMGEFVQDALDCIEYANGPADSEWGAKRAAAGHPEPFGMKYLEIGNENGGKEYEERYALIAKAVREKYPDVQLVFDNWKETKRVDDPKDLRDDHFYDHPDRLMGGLAHEYDERKGDFGIFVGEYAVVRGTHRYGSLRGAIGEAAFMMGLERNQNQVKLAAYAPLFANAQHTVWTPNLIYPMTLGSFVNPSWTVQKLFTENRGAEVLKVDVKTGTFETDTAFAWGKGTNHNVIENVQASAVMDRDGSVILKVANCTEEPQTIRVDGVKGKAKKTLFGGGDRMAHNSPAEPEALKETVSEIDFDGTDVLPPLSLVIYRMEPSKRAGFDPSWESLEKRTVPEWYDNAKFGIFCHWGMQCAAEDGDWYARCLYDPNHWQGRHHRERYGDPKEFGAKDLIPLWKGERWNPEELCALYRKMGATFILAMANHHDNFDNWNSRYQPWNSVNMGPKRDILGEWSKAARKNGLRFGASFHAAHAWTWLEVSRDYDGLLTKDDGKGKWWEGFDPQQLYWQNHEPSPGYKDLGAIHRRWAWGGGASRPSDEFMENFRLRTMDAVAKYKPDLIYFDDTILPFYNVSDTGLRIVADFYNLNPEGVAAGKCLDERQRKAITWDVERGTPPKPMYPKWQTDTCIGNWHYERSVYDRGHYKSAAQVVGILVDVVSKNGNLCLSIPIRSDGTIDEKERKVCEDVAAWMAVNREAIFDTVPYEVCGEGPQIAAAPPLQAQGFNEGRIPRPVKEDVRYLKAKSGKRVYAIELAPDGTPPICPALEAKGMKLAKSFDTMPGFPAVHVFE